MGPKLEMHDAFRCLFFALHAGFHLWRVCICASSLCLAVMFLFIFVEIIIANHFGNGSHSSECHLVYISIAVLCASHLSPAGFIGSCVMHVCVILNLSCMSTPKFSVGVMLLISRYSLFPCIMLHDFGSSSFCA